MSSQYVQAMEDFFTIHREDPKTVVISEDGGTVEKHYAEVYHEAMLRWVEALTDNPSEALRLAAACQHIRRWSIPRDRHPLGREGYKEWRRELSKLHADIAAEVLSRCGYGQEFIERVQFLLMKRKLKRDEESQLLEDAVCLTFLELEFAEFAPKHPDEKMIDIIRKTWVKMSEQGHEKALKLSLPDWGVDLVKRALSED